MSWGDVGSAPPAGSETRPIVRAVDVEGLVLRAALVVQLGGARVGEVDLDARRDDADDEQRDVEGDPPAEVGGVVRAEVVDLDRRAVAGHVRAERVAACEQKYIQREHSEDRGQNWGPFDFVARSPVMNY